MAMAESWRCASGSNPPIITAVSLAHHSDISSIPTYHKTQLKTRKKGKSTLISSSIPACHKTQLKKSKKRKVYAFQQHLACMSHNTVEEKGEKDKFTLFSVHIRSLVRR